MQFDWHSILLGEEDWNYLLQAAFKTVVMFIVVVIALRLIGRRGVMQGVFEVLTIVMLGSSAGDPMLYSKVGLLPAITIFVAIVLLYRTTNLVISKSYSAEKVVEGKPIRIIKDNRFEDHYLHSPELDKDELFADLRKHGVSHLGQVQYAYLEPGGELSVFFLEDKEVKFGLPVLPECYEKNIKEIDSTGYYSCDYCGHTESISPRSDHHCPNCKNDKWVESMNSRRIT